MKSMYVCMYVCMYIYITDTLTPQAWEGNESERVCQKKRNGGGVVGGAATKSASLRSRFRKFEQSGQHGLEQHASTISYIFLHLTLGTSGPSKTINNVACSSSSVSSIVGSIQEPLLATTVERRRPNCPGA